MPGAGCEDMAAVGSEGRRGVRMSLRFGGATVEAMLAISFREDSLCVFFALAGIVGVSRAYIGSVVGDRAV